jgi:hypothetical protein
MLHFSSIFGRKLTARASLPQFGASVSVFQDSNEGDYVLAVGVLQDTTTVALGESYDRSNHGSVYLFQSNLCCMNGPAYATAGSDCDAPYSTTDCADTWGQVSRFSRKLQTQHTHLCILMRITALHAQASPCDGAQGALCELKLVQRCRG